MEYAVYKGDELIAMGKAKDCAEKLNVTPSYIQWMTTPSGIKRHNSRKHPERCTTAIKLEVNDD